jgi:hypothetical protein
MAYEETFNELKRRSNPYLEYHDSEGFTPHRETFVVYPKTTLEELNQWKSLGVPGDRRFPIDGNSSHQITMLQFHFGIPLYSIDEIEHWHDTYKKVLTGTPRPLHKFDPARYNMKDPYINIAKVKPILEEDVRKLYNWALDVTRDHEEGYPIFKIADNGMYVIDEGSEAVQRFYYDRHTENFLTVERIQALIDKQPLLKDELIKAIKRAILSSGIMSKVSTGSSIHLFNAEGSQEQKQQLVIPVLREFSQMGEPKDGVVKVDAAGSIHVSKNIIKRDYKAFVNNFYVKRQYPVPKSGITDDMVVTELASNPALFTAFMRVVSEAYDDLEIRNVLKRHPLPAGLSLGLED